MRNPARRVGTFSLSRARAHNGRPKFRMDVPITEYNYGTDEVKVGYLCRSPAASRLQTKVHAGNLPHQSCKTTKPCGCLSAEL